jgi:hypothetical protein
MRLLYRQRAYFITLTYTLYNSLPIIIDFSSKKFEFIFFLAFICLTKARTKLFIHLNLRLLLCIIIGRIRNRINWCLISDLKRTSQPILFSVFNPSRKINIEIGKAVLAKYRNDKNNKGKKSELIYQVEFILFLQ